MTWSREGQLHMNYHLKGERRRLTMFSTKYGDPLPDELVNEDPEEFMNKIRFGPHFYKGWEEYETQPGQRKEGFEEIGRKARLVTLINRYQERFSPTVISEDSDSGVLDQDDEIIWTKVGTPFSVLEQFVAGNFNPADMNLNVEVKNIEVLTASLQCHGIILRSKDLLRPYDSSVGERIRAGSFWKKGTEVKTSKTREASEKAQKQGLKILGLDKS